MSTRRKRMSNVELIRTGELTDEAPYAYAATVPADDALVFTAGACPLDADGRGRPRSATSPGRPGSPWTTS